MPRDVKKRGKPSFVNRRNRSKLLRKRDNKKKQSRSTFDVIKNKWDETKTARENIQDMGIAFNPNEVVPIRQERKEIIDIAPIDGKTILEEPVVVKRVTRRKKDEKQAQFVVSQIEKEAKKQEDETKAQGRKFQLFHRETELCVYMLARHGDDFQAMTRDPKNLWQYTPKQWARKIKVYKDSEMCKFIEST